MWRYGVECTTKNGLFSDNIGQYFRGRLNCIIISYMCTDTQFVCSYNITMLSKIGRLMWLKIHFTRVFMELVIGRHVRSRS